MQTRIFTGLCAMAAAVLFFSLKIFFFPSAGKISNITKHPQYKERELSAIDALQFLSASAAFPHKDIPPDAYAKAEQFIQEKYAVNKMQMAGSWQSIGPNNIGGRTLCVAIDPTDTAKIWLGSASGGLWKSTTGGIGVNAWTYVPTGFPVLGVSTIVINPNNPNEMYIGTGETYSYGTSTNGVIDRTTRGTVGMGILKSTDGGNTWTQSLNWTYQQNRGVWEIIFNPLNINILYAATTEGIYKTTDAGISWTQVLNVQMAMDLEIDRIDTHIVYCGVGNLSSIGKGLYKTTNSGATWNILSNGLPANTQTGRIIISAYYNNPDILIAEVSNAFNTIGFYRSTNEGANWTSASPQDIGWYQGWFAKGLLFNPGDPTKVLAGGVEVHTSFDAGDNFIQVSNNNFTTDYVHVDIHDIVANPLDPNKIYIVCDGGLFRSNDFGTTFYECTDGYVTSQFYIGSVSSQDSSMALGGLQDNWTDQYTGTNYWTPVLGGDGMYNAIDPTDDWNQFAAYQYQNIFISTDRGSSFNQTYWGSSTSYAFLAPYVLSPSNPQTLYGGGKIFIKSTDGGSTWNSIGPSPFDGSNYILSIGVAPSNANIVYCGTVPVQSNPMHIFKSTDGGNTFTNVTGNNLPNRYPREITVNPANSNELYVVFSGFGTGHIFKSINGGTTWTDISTTLPDLPFHCLAIDPQNPTHLFAGCDYGMFLSTDAGNTWNTFNTGFPEAVMVFDIAISPSNMSLTAFTHGHGVYKRKLSDVTGIGDNNSQQISSLKIFPNPSSSFTSVEFYCPTASPAELKVYDLNGNLVYKKNFENISMGKNSVQIDVDGFAEGTYLAVVQTDKKIFAAKMMVMK